MKLYTFDKSPRRVQVFVEANTRSYCAGSTCQPLVLLCETDSQHAVASLLCQVPEGEVWTAKLVLATAIGLKIVPETLLIRSTKVPLSLLVSGGAVSERRKLWDAWRAALLNPEVTGEETHKARQQYLDTFGP